MRKVTIKDVAREAGVSISLVSFVMNNVRNEQDGEKKKYSVNEETANKILEVAGRLGYRPNKAASSLRSGRQYTIGVITSDIANHFFSDIARYIENVAYKNGYTVLFASTDESASKTESIVDTFLDNSVDGMIIAPCKGSTPYIKKVVDARIPTVLIDRDIPEVDCGKVLLDNFKAGRMAAGHLISSGYRKIAMVNYTLGISSMTERELGYRSAMSDSGLGEYVSVSYTAYGNAEKDVMDFIADAVARGVEAVIFPTNTISVLGLKAIHDFGIKVPDRLAVICFDNNDSYDLYSPRMTRITQSTKDMAFGAFSMLKDMIENSQYGHSRRLLLEPEMICRESTVAVGETQALSVRTPEFTLADSILLPAASFHVRGGWVLDSGPVMQIGAPCLSSHAFGEPAADAETEFNVLHDAGYNVWVRMRPASGSERTAFGISVDGRTMSVGADGGTAGWSWKNLGKVSLMTGKHRAALHDPSGSGVGCECVLFTSLDGMPGDDTRALRRVLFPGREHPEFKGCFDLAVYGGTVAGICAAVAAAREGLKVALVHDRSILGGANSSEFRTGLGGRVNMGRFPSLGYMLNEFAPEHGGNDNAPRMYEDEKKSAFVEAEANIAFFRNYVIDEVIKAEGGKIDAVVLTDVVSNDRIWLKAELFMDCMHGGLFAAMAANGEYRETADEEELKGASGPFSLASFFDEPYSMIRTFGIPNFMKTSCPQIRTDSRTGLRYVPRACGVEGEAAGIIAALCSKSETGPQTLMSECREFLAEALGAGAGRTDVPYTQVYDLDMN